MYGIFTYIYHMYGIFTYLCLIFMVTVGKYTSPMDPLGYEKKQCTLSEPSLAEKQAPQPFVLLDLLVIFLLSSMANQHQITIF